MNWDDPLLREHLDQPIDVLPTDQPDETPEVRLNQVVTKSNQVINRINVVDRRLHELEKNAKQLEFRLGGLQNLPSETNHRSGMLRFIRESLQISTADFKDHELVSTVKEKTKNASLPCYIGRVSSPEALSIILRSAKNLRFDSRKCVLLQLLLPTYVSHSFNAKSKMPIVQLSA